jgi:hypothetical protein
MREGSPGVNALVRKAFGILIEIRQREDAARSLALANAFLRMLARDPGRDDTTSFVVSIKAMPIRANQADSASARNPRRGV